MRDVIPNAKLRMKDVPAPDAPWDEIERFALTYDGYVEAGSFEACAEIANARRGDTLDDLRASLFFEQRRWRHSGGVPDGEELKHIRDVVRQIRVRVQTQRLTDKNGLPRFWWSALPCIPSAHDSLAYRRLRTIWGDQSRFRRVDERRYAEFVNPAVETNFMVTLWENFALFTADVWVPALANAVGLSNEIGAVREASWSYGWRCPTGEGRKNRIVDIVVHFRGDGGRDGLLIIEAKRPGGRLAEKDLAVGTYLDLPALAKVSDRRWLVFCVSDADSASVRAHMDDRDGRSRVFTWEKLGGLQIRLVEKLGVPETLRSFICGAIQYQYCQHGIRPSRLAAPYLESEPAIEAMDSRAGGSGLKDLPPTAPLWRLL